jgi:hypothetical protein
MKTMDEGHYYDVTFNSTLSIGSALDQGFDYIGIGVANNNRLGDRLYVYDFEFRLLLSPNTPADVGSPLTRHQVEPLRLIIFRDLQSASQPAAPSFLDIFGVSGSYLAQQLPDTMSRYEILFDHVYKPDTPSVYMRPDLYTQATGLFDTSHFWCLNRTPVKIFIPINENIDFGKPGTFANGDSLNAPYPKMYIMYYCEEDWQVSGTSRMHFDPAKNETSSRR